MRPLRGAAWYVAFPLFERVRRKRKPITHLRQGYGGQANNFFLRHLSFLQSLRQCSKVTRRDLHRPVGAGLWIEDTLFLDVRFESSACVTHGMAACVAKRGSFAGHDASACHRVPE